MAKHGAAYLWRSSVMYPVEIVVSCSAAMTTLRSIRDNIHLVDMNSDVDNADLIAWKRRYQLTTIRIQRIETLIEAMKSLLTAEPNVARTDTLSLPDLDWSQKTSTPSELGKFAEFEAAFAQQHSVVGHLGRDLVRLKDRRHVLELCQAIGAANGAQDVELARRSSPSSPTCESRPFLADQEPGLRVVCGCVPSPVRISFTRQVWRHSRGNAHIHWGKHNAASISFCVFVVGRHMQLKIRHLAGLNGTLHEVDDMTRLNDEICAIDVEIFQCREVLDATKAHIDSSVARQLPVLHQLLQSARVDGLLYRAMQLTKAGPSKTRYIRGWTSDIGELSRSLVPDYADPSIPESVLHLDIDPQLLGTRPTHFPINDFTSPMQELVDTLGCARYGEINAAYLTCVTFPFLFGMMFADVGHGAIITIYAFYLCLATNHRFPAMTSCRYTLLLMGLFAIYSGAIYNEFFGFDLNMFASGWVIDRKSGSLLRESVYPFGIDHVWSESPNRLELQNSIKMKLAIIFGMVHQLAGLGISAMNQIHTGHIDHLVTIVVPQFVFTGCTFGYMCLLIILKAGQSWDGREAPSILQNMVQMFIGGGSSDGPVVFPGQHAVQSLLFDVAILMIPIIWLGKPFWKRYQKSKNASRIGFRAIYSYLDEYDADLDNDQIELIPLTVERNASLSTIINIDESDRSARGVPHDDQDGALDEFVHQSIQMIEFVLGTVSNTASYLRLWALSLAHQQLSAVILSCILLPGLSSSHILIRAIGVTIWISATLGILCAMDALECILHAVRLHWVEHMGKYYHGDGYRYTPIASWRP